MIGLIPTQGFDGGIGFRAGAGGVGADEGVFAIGLVPDGDEMGPQFGRQQAGLKLSPALMGEPVPHAKRVFAQNHVFIHKLCFECGKPTKLAGKNELDISAENFGFSALGEQGGNRV
jgi:hypothetical protein